MIVKTNPPRLRRSYLGLALIILMPVSFYLSLNLHPIDLYSLFGIILFFLIALDWLALPGDGKLKRLGIIVIMMAVVSPLIILTFFAFPSWLRTSEVFRGLDPKMSDWTTCFIPAVLMGFPFGFMADWIFDSLKAPSHSSYNTGSHLSNVSHDLYELGRKSVVLILGALLFVIPVAVKVIIKAFTEHSYALLAFVPLIIFAAFGVQWLWNWWKSRKEPAFQSIGIHAHSDK